MEETEQHPSSGMPLWIKVALGGCLLLLVLIVSCGYLVVKNAKGVARELTATFVEAGAKALVSELPPDEQKTVAPLIEAFAQSIRDGRVSLGQGAAVADALAEGPVVTVIIARGFEVKYLQASGLSDQEKQAGHRAITRYCYGVVEELVPESTREELGDIVTVQVGSGNQGNRQLKDSLTDEEVRLCLQIMEGAADEAGIEDKEFQVDLGAEIQKAINYGMSNPKK